MNIEFKFREALPSDKHTLATNIKYKFVVLQVRFPESKEKITIENDGRTAVPRWVVEMGEWQDVEIED